MAKEPSRREMLKLWQLGRCRGSLALHRHRLAVIRPAGLPNCVVSIFQGKQSHISEGLPPAVPSWNYFKLFFTFAIVPPVLVPRLVAATMIAVATRDAMIPYSNEVTPASSLKKQTNSFCMC